MAMRFDFLVDRRGNFSIAVCLLCVPLLMGVAMSIDYGRINSARSAAYSALQTAVRVSSTSDGKIDTDLVRDVYRSALKLPGGQSSTPPVFSVGADGKRQVAVRTATRLTLGGLLLPKNYYSVVTIPAEAVASPPPQASPPPRKQ